MNKWHDDVIRVVVCDDHALLRRRLVILLEDEPDIDVMGEASDGDQSIALSRELAPDVVVVGMRIENIGGPRTAAGIREVVPAAHVVMLVTPDDETESMRAIKAGTTGFLHREVIEQAAAVVRAVSAGIVVLPPAVVQRVLDEYESLGRQAGSVQQQLEPPAIDERERAVLTELAKGATYGAAAEACGLAGHTVKNLAANTIEKLYRHARTEAVLYAVGERFFQRA